MARRGVWDGGLEDTPGPVRWAQALRSLRQGCGQRRQLWARGVRRLLAHVGSRGPLGRVALEIREEAARIK